MNPIKINYPVLRGGDIFLSHSNKPLSKIIRLAETMRFAPRDNLTPTHAGVIVKLDGQFFACEMKPRLTINSLEKYAGKREQIVSVYRPCYFDDAETLATAQRRLMLWIRKNGDNIKYDPIGAVLSSPLGDKLIGWIPGVRNATERRFCSESVCDTLIMAGDKNIGAALNPLQLGQWLKTWKCVYKHIPDAIIHST
jgi:hypothetical protein